jgi:predicted flap endonuclease-1-like 5' DNA nuclease
MVKERNMKRREFAGFWVGFVITAAVVAYLYWLWQQRREVTPRPLVVSSRQPDALPASQEPPSDRDDLTAIKGIGPVFAKRLNKAGIFTFAQLAAQSPEKIESVTQVTRWDPEDWIAEAKKLA